MSITARSLNSDRVSTMSNFMCYKICQNRAVASGASEGGGWGERYMCEWIARSAVGEAAQRPSEAAGVHSAPQGGV